MELIHQTKYKRLTKKGLYWFDYLRPYREQDFITQLNNEIHNNKRDRTHSIHKVLAWMKTNGIKDSKELFDYLTPRWTANN